VTAEVEREEERAEIRNSNESVSLSVHKSSVNDIKRKKHNSEPRRKTQTGYLCAAVTKTSFRAERDASPKSLICTHTDLLTY